MTYLEESTNIQEAIKEQINSNDVILYMKGTPGMPKCGFSAKVVNHLKACCPIPFATVDVLENDVIRHGIKEYANWPTIPQLYIKGEFIGGCDIITEMYDTGELQAMLEKLG